VVVAGCSQQNAEPFGAADVDHPGYQHHTQISVEDAVAQYDDVVLFFGASRCPLCRSLNSDIRENLDMIPEDLVIVTYDYDTAEDEKEMYEVTSQHTLIYLDDDGEEMKRTVKQETTLQAVVDEFAALNGEENTA
jgi:thiol-disulfide isomerase/thioredoxin